MSFFRIVSPVQTDRRAFTTFGLSANRADDSAIGQFGSGNKHGVNCLLRMGISPTITLGNEAVTFDVRTDKFHGQEIDQVQIRDNNGNVEDAPWTLNYGEHDWNGAKMALREFIANAIDAAKGAVELIRMDTVDSIEGKEGTTTYFIPLEDEVKEAVQDVKTLFLHFSNDQDKDIIPIRHGEKGRIYLKGVLQTEVQSKKLLFHYNMTSKHLKTSESRILTGDRIHSAVSEFVYAYNSPLKKNTEFWKLYWETLLAGDNEHFEYGVSEWRLESIPQCARDILIAMLETKGKKAVVCTQEWAKMVQDRNYVPVILPANFVRMIHKKQLWRTELDVFSTVERKGKEKLYVPDDMMEQADKVWKSIRKIGMNRGKRKPKIYGFRDMQVSGCKVLGFWERESDSVWLDVDEAGLTTIMEEFIHYITGSVDETREFQNFTIQLASAFMKQNWRPSRK